MKIAILGAGNIAATLAYTMQRLDEVECYAVAARQLSRAEAFAKKHGFEKAYGSYEEMLADKEVELVYIATPHSHHYEHMKLCIEAGKHVLCEKAFTMNEKQAREIFALAEEKGVLVTEAIWTRYMPSRKIINDLLAEGVIGEVKTLTANLSYMIADKERIIRPELAGGALLDVGVYTLNFALMHFGSQIAKKQSVVHLTETGVDGQNVMTLFYEDGRLAVLTSGIYGLSDRQGVFYGSQGYMIVENINNPSQIRIYDKEHKLLKTLPVPEQISGYEYEIRETIDCIKQGKRECPSMRHEDTLEVMRIMDGFRKEWGVCYPNE
ncbi:MAG: Gfo/Idh/MocA family oxidoreductase [Bacillus sp. (in: Bacteria)]|nr:Gfo/Idh/MocA family oxidoreductase [Bacillus sp. (in: firmicutes)]MCM1426113.1 Gfo/Idh/MocA family oxidoreductase [Eubacterium sp.]